MTAGFRRTKDGGFELTKGMVALLASLIAIAGALLTVGAAAQVVKGAVSKDELRAHVINDANRFEAFVLDSDRRFLFLTKVACRGLVSPQDSELVRECDRQQRLQQSRIDAAEQRIREQVAGQ